jgi:hypothetical protein
LFRITAEINGLKIKQVTVGQKKKTRNDTGKGSGKGE